MRSSHFCPLLILLAACHQQGPKAPADVSKDTIGTVTVTTPVVNDHFEADHRVFSSFKDSVAASMELTNSQQFHWLREDTTGPRRRQTGRELRRLGNMYVMVIDFDYGSYKLYTLDSATYTLADQAILGFNTDSDGDDSGSSCDYEFVNDSTIEVMVKDFAPEGSKRPEQLVRNTYVISGTGKITEIHNNQ